MCVWTSFIYNKTISRQVLCFQANILLVYLWLPCGYLVPSCCNYSGCTSFFVDIYRHDFVYLDPYTLERNYISRWYPFFHVHLVFLMLFLWWLRESFFLECVSSIIASWCTLVWWRLFSSCLSLRGLVSLVLMSLSSSIFTTGCHKHRFSICLLVSLWTHLPVVCGNDRPCTLCLILSRLCWCLMLILILVFSSASPWLTHIILVEPILKLPLLHVAQPRACCKR